MADQTHNAGVHTHVDENGNVITHCHDGEVHMHEHDHAHSHGHGHTHTHTQTKAVINRLARAIGHLESVKRMVEDGRDCAEVLIQLAAVRSALNNTAKMALQPCRAVYKLPQQVQVLSPMDWEHSTATAAAFRTVQLHWTMEFLL